MNETSFNLDRIGGSAALDSLKAEVRAAGDAAMAYFDSGVQVERKADASPVTEADRAVEARIRRYLEEHYPHAGFLGEESGSQEGSELRFIVDPIDGTRAFIRGLPTWSVLVGLEADGVPSIGIAYMPAAGDFFVGVRGAGATCNDERLSVSSTSRLEDALVTHGAVEQFLDTGLGPQLLALGAAAYTTRGFADFDGYRQVLLGRSDAMVDPGVKPYDICAAAVLVREAGGRFTSFDGTETIFGGGAVATNGLIHDPVLSVLEQP